MSVWTFIRRNGFVLALVLLFVLVDAVFANWNPMVTSRRFAKNDFTKTLFHHGWTDSGRVFYGNSSVTGAYMEDKSRHPLVEMGLSYGTITDLKAILQKPWYHVQDELVLGIDVHTMLDKMPTDPTYQWLRKPYQPYVYQYRDYFKDSGTELAKQAWYGLVELKPGRVLEYEPRWIDKELYFGRKSPEDLQKDQDRYNKLFNWMTVEDTRKNLDALDWVLDYADDRGLKLLVVWMPYNPRFPHPPYFDELKRQVNAKLEAHRVPVLDRTDAYGEELFHDIVHVNREDGAPQFTREVDAWLDSSATSSK